MLDEARARAGMGRTSCENFLYGFKAARRAARAAATAPWPPLPLALPRRPGQRRSAGAKRRNAAARHTASFTCAGGSSLLPLPGLSGAGQDPSRPSVIAGQPHPASCRVNVHAKTALTEPARTRRWQLSEAGTRVAWALTLNPSTAPVLGGLQICRSAGPQARYGCLTRRRVPAGQAVI